MTKGVVVDKDIKAELKELRRVKEDLYGNRWDILQYKGSTPYVAAVA